MCDSISTALGYFLENSFTSCSLGVRLCFFIHFQVNWTVFYFQNEPTQTETHPKTHRLIFSNVVRDATQCRDCVCFVFLSVSKLNFINVCNLRECRIAVPESWQQPQKTNKIIGDLWFRRRWFSLFVQLRSRFSGLFRSHAAWKCVQFIHHISYLHPPAFSFLYN